MLSSIKVQDEKREEGFTLIELLVVVIIIGILAAIAIPVFLNQRESAWRSAAESDARNAAIAIETFMTSQRVLPPAETFTWSTDADGGVWYVEPEGTGYAWDTGTPPAESLSELTVSRDVTLVYAVDADNSNIYTITASHARVNSGDDSIVYNSATGGLADTWLTSGGAGDGDA